MSGASDLPGALIADLADVPGSVWAAPSPAPVYTAREWLAASRWPGDGMRYLTAGGLMVPVRSVTDPAAWARMNLVDICAGTAFGDWADPDVVARARARAVPHLLVAAPGYFTLPIGPADGDVSAIVDAVEGQGQAAGFAYLPPEAGSLAGELRRRGYTTGMVSVTTRLDLPGDSFDDYLAGLSGRRRGQVRHEIRCFSRAGGTIDHASGAEVIEHLPLVARLENALQRAHGYAAGDESYLALNRRFADLFGSSLHLLRASLHGEPVATVTLLHVGDDLVVRAYGGVDSPEVRGAVVYFNLVYYASIAVALRLAVRRVWFGTSTIEAKRGRGMALVPLIGAVGPAGGDALRSLLTETDTRLRGMLTRWLGG
jgi:peptidoglycan biosynthesis/recognition FemAB-like protein